MDENTVNLMDKNLNDLTVRDAVKINFVVIAATIGIPVVILTAGSAIDKMRLKLSSRKNRLHVNTPTELEK